MHRGRVAWEQNPLYGFNLCTRHSSLSVLRMITLRLGLPNTRLGLAAHGATMAGRRAVKPGAQG